MDVTCDRCGTEYEFEETLVSPRGTTVKCTQCGHLFKVYRQEAGLAAQLVGNHWTVRRVDGSSHQLPSLTELMRLITEGGFARDDEVSRTGKAWRRLGDIEELEACFADADRRGPSRARKSTQGPVLGLSQPKQPAATTERTALRSSDPGIAPTARTSAPGARASEPGEARATPAQRSSPAAVSGEHPPVQRADDDDVATEQRPLSSRSPAGTPGLRAGSAPPPIAASASVEQPRPSRPTPASGAPSARPIEFPNDIDDRSELNPAPRSSLWLWIFAVASTGLALSTWLFWPAAPTQPKHAALTDMSAQYLERADRIFAAHRTEHFDEAITEYTKSLAFHENDPHVLSSLSRVYAVWAQELRWLEPVKDRAADKSKSAGQSAAASANSARFERLAEHAKAYAESAARKNPGNAEGEVALSDALRLTGNLVSARSELDRARASDPDPSAETLRVAALLAIDEADGDARAGIALASQAVAQDPELIRTQLLLARCLVADGDLQAARIHVQLVTARDRDHPGARAIIELIDKANQPPESLDAGNPEAVAKVAPDAGAPPSPQYESLSHEGYISRGQAMLESGQVSSAKRMFEQALFIRPNSTQAHTGLGYVALEKGRPQLAAEHFVSAARAGNDEALIGLADAYRRMSRNRDALRAYQNYLTRNPTGKQASIALAQIERLSEELGRNKKAQ